MSELTAIVEEFLAEEQTDEQRADEDLVCRYSPNRYLEACLRPAKHVWISFQRDFAEWPENLAA